MPSTSIKTEQIKDDAVTFDKIENASAESILIGRGTGNGGGNYQAVTLGSGLTMTGTTLSASGGGGGLGAPTYAVIKTADETITSSTTIQDDDELFQALTSGKSYWIELKLILTRTDTVNNVNGKYVIDGNSEGYMVGTLMNNTSTLSFGGLGGVAIAGLPIRRFDTGTLKLSTNYTLKFRWSQETSSTTGVTVMKGSQLLIWEF